MASSSGSGRAVAARAEAARESTVRAYPAAVVCPRDAAPPRGVVCRDPSRDDAAPPRGVAATAPAPRRYFAHGLLAKWHTCCCCGLSVYYVLGALGAPWVIFNTVLLTIILHLFSSIVACVGRCCLQEDVPEDS